MVSKNNYQQQNIGGTGGMRHQRSNHNLRTLTAPYRKPFKPPLPLLNDMQYPLMFASSQMPSDPLYVDFNAPTIPVARTNKQVSPRQQTPNTNSKQQQNQEHTATKQDQQKKKDKEEEEEDKDKNKDAQQGKEKKEENGQQEKQQTDGKKGSSKGGGGKQKGKQQQQNGNWLMNQHNNMDRFNRNMQHCGNFNGPLMNRMGRHMMPPPLPLGPLGPMPPLPPMGFQSPMVPPMVGLRPPIPPPHFMRRNGRSGMHHGMPPLIPPMLANRMPLRGMLPHMLPFNALGNGCNGMGMGGNNGILNGIGPNGINNGKVKKPNVSLIKQSVKSKNKSTIKTLKNLINQYPINKPWVSDEIRSEHAKKVDIENRLKGHKDDELFAKFKLQRDKFVKMYEVARDEYLKQEAAKVKAKAPKNKKAAAGNSSAASTIVTTTAAATTTATTTTGTGTTATTTVTSTNVTTTKTITPNATTTKVTTAKANITTLTNANGVAVTGKIVEKKTKLANEKKAATSKKTEKTVAKVNTKN